MNLGKLGFHSLLLGQYPAITVNNVDLKSLTLFILNKHITLYFIIPNVTLVSYVPPNIHKILPVNISFRYFHPKSP